MFNENQPVPGTLGSDGPACTMCSAAIIIGSAAIPIAKAILNV